MKPTQKSLKPHITRWVQDDLITQDQADSILEKYPADSRSSATMTFSIIGGLLCVLGLVLLVSANWQVIPREAKLGGLLSLLIASTLLGIESSRRKWHPAITEISYLFAAVLPLVGLTLVGQFFNLRGSGFTLVLTWFGSILLLPFLDVIHCLVDVSLFVDLFWDKRVPLGVVRQRSPDRTDNICCLWHHDWRRFTVVEPGRANSPTSVG